MMNSKSSTFISGVLAFGIYFVLLITLLFYFNMREENKPIHYVKKNEDRIRISMASPKSEAKKQTKKVEKKQPKKKVEKKKVEKKKVAEKKATKKKTIKKEEVKKKVVPEKVVKKKVIKEKVVKKAKPPKKKKETKSTTKKVNKPKDLFANVTANKKPEKKRIYKPKVSASELFNNSIKVQKPSDRGIENAYLAKVEEKLNGWPAQSEYAGEKAKVSLKIQSNGRFTFKVITGSANPGFNEGLIAYLEQLQKFGFGPHKGGRVYSIDVEFVATE